MRLILVWTGLLALMIANGVVRADVYGPVMTELGARLVPSATGIPMLDAYT